MTCPRRPAMDGEPKSYRLTDGELCRLDPAEWDREWAAHRTFFDEHISKVGSGYITGWGSGVAKEA